MRSVTSRALAVIAALIVTAAGSACQRSSSDEHDAGAKPTTSTTSAGSTAHNPDDVAFLQNMIPHHEQALALSALVPDHSTDTDLIALAHQIADQQRSEINGFRAQLMQWEEPFGPAQHAQMDGMVDQATMDRLQTLRGAEFDKLWLESMIAHHRGAITMAQNEIAHGHSPDVIGIAKSIEASQQAEVDHMEQMLGAK